MSKRRQYWLLGLLCVPVVLGLTLPQSWATDQAGQRAGDEVGMPPGGITIPVPADGAKPDEEKKKRFPDIAKVTKDMQPQAGLITLYRYAPSDKQHDPEKLLAKIPAGLLGQDLLFSTSISRGRFAGFMWGDQLIRWQIAGNKVKLVTPNLRYVDAKGQPVSVAVERTYTDTFIAAVPIVAMSPAGDVVIDMGGLLKSDLARVSLFGGAVRADLSTWNKVKVFPNNVLIDVSLALGGRRGGSSVGVSYDFRRLPAPGNYKPRAADPRIGYFLTAKMDWSKKANERELFDRFIHRWNLEKRDSTLELSPPKKPIVFIIEKTVPIQWRRWVREGIEEWNKAFEKIGFTGAIIVQQQTDDNEYANYDPEDSRYNFFRWGVSGRAFAFGPSRVDPRTGEILDADILFDDAFTRAWMYNFDLYGPESLGRFKGPGFEQWLDEQPEMVPDFMRDTLARETSDTDDQMWSLLDEELQKQGRCSCQYAWGMQHQLSLAHHAMIATGSGEKKIPERLVGEAIREIVTHEVGHTLGLRHNFKASSWLTLDEIKRRRNETDEPTTASVMDYTPLLFFAGDKLENVRHCVTPTIGPYDEWAIEYGYAIPDGKPEAEMLKEITGRCTEPELQYATDWDTMWVFSPDPLVNRYDLSSDPIDYARARIELVDNLLADITDWAVQDGEPPYFLLRAFNTLWYERVSNLDYVARVVGGQYFHYDFKGDTNERAPLVLVEPDRQRAALAYLGETVFNSEFFEVKPEVLNRLAPSRWGHWGSSAGMRLDYPIHDRIRGLQMWVLSSLTAAPVVQRIYDAELKSAADDKFTAAEAITTLRDLIWRQLDARGGRYDNSQPMIDSVTRNLQQDYLNIQLNMARVRPGVMVSSDVRSMVRQALRELGEKIGTTLRDSNIDFASRAHLTECQSRIEHVLDAQFQAR